MAEGPSCAHRAADRAGGSGIAHPGGCTSRCCCHVVTAGVGVTRVTGCAAHRCAHRSGAAEPREHEATRRSPWGCLGPPRGHATAGVGLEPPQNRPHVGSPGEGMLGGQMASKQRQVERNRGPAWPAQPQETLCEDNILLMIWARRLSAPSVNVGLFSLENRSYRKTSLQRFQT